MKWTYDNLIKIRMTGSENTVTCLVCDKSERWSQVDEFIPLRRPSLKTDGKTEITIRSNKDFIKYFADQHLKWHNKE